MSRFFLGAYWSVRRESLDGCAERMRSFFAALANCDHAFAAWYERADSKKSARKKRADVGDRQYLRELLERSRHWTDMPKRLMPEIGFSPGLWNGQDDLTSASLNITCGSYSETIANRIVLDMPCELGALANSQRMDAVLVAAAQCWEPDWAGVMSYEAMRRRKFNAFKPFVDWMLYISDLWLPKVPPFEPPTSVQRLPGGTLIVVQQEPPDPRNPVHLGNIRRVRNALRRRVKIDV
jgi:hypothetical protein